ncbi:MAG: 3-isopropylmalate dehydrogenase [Xanthomonadales bacterium]|nr:3-isopropylmalate dehydrogenase [Xanthomonadales bacterium]
MKAQKIAILPGDGIGPEVMQQTLRVLKQVAPHIQVEQGLIGGAAYVKFGNHFPDATKRLIDEADAVLFGSVGGPVELSDLPQWKDCEVNSILALRNHLKLSVNYRPAKFYPALRNISPLKNTRLEGCDEILILRELLGDIYFGEKKTWQENNNTHAQDTANYDAIMIEHMAHQAFKTAAQRSGKLTSVDKANVLNTSKLWRQVFTQVAEEYPEVELTHMLVDNCAMQLILKPAQFDVIATSNLFGDILSDAASALPGSLGMMPSASFSVAGKGLYEPSGGSAPDIAGKDVANPMAQILSLAMLLRYSLAMESSAVAIEQAIERTLTEGYRTQDIGEPGQSIVGTEAFTSAVISHL